MPMTSFNVGPAQLDPALPGVLQRVLASGVLSLSHRGAEFAALYQDVMAGFRRVLELPEDYTLYFLSSATECWSVLAESGIERSALHLWSGSFGERWMQQAARIAPETKSLSFGIGDDPMGLPLPEGAFELIAVTHNETSNTTCVPFGLLGQLRQRYPEALLAVDVTSSLGGVQLPWAQADVWFGSVQKCLGLPAGLGVMAVNPRAVWRFATLNRRTQYNNLVALHAYALQHQTTHTPNVLGIALLGGVLASRAPIAQVQQELEGRARAYYQLIEQHPVLQPLVPRAESRSVTTIGVQAEAELVARVKAQAKALGMHLASGYGPWKSNSFRIANFPAIGAPAVERLCDFLDSIR